jgi:hypothetical protein
MAVRGDGFTVLFADNAEGNGESTTREPSFLSPYVTGREVFHTSENKWFEASFLSPVFRYAFSIRKIAEREHFDLIYAHDWLSFPAGIAAKAVSGKMSKKL